MLKKDGIRWTVLEGEDPLPQAANIQITDKKSTTKPPTHPSRRDWNKIGMISHKKSGTREEYVPTHVRLFVMFVILFVMFVITFVNFYVRTQNQGGQELKIE